LSNGQNTRKEALTQAKRLKCDIVIGPISKIQMLVNKFMYACSPISSKLPLKATETAIILDSSVFADIPTLLSFCNPNGDMVSR
jgi:hypothetical protein